MVVGPKGACGSSTPMSKGWALLVGAQEPLIFMEAQLRESTQYWDDCGNSTLVHVSKPRVHKHGGVLL